MAKPTKDQILDLLEDNEYDYHVLPHYGLISDWYVRSGRRDLVAWGNFSPG